MNKKALILSMALLFLLVLGMIVFAYLRRAEFSLETSLISVFV